MSLVTLGATYDGTPLLAFASGRLRLIIRLIRGLDESPTVRGEDTVVPGTPGKVPRARVWESRTIELEGEIIGTGADLAAELADIRAALESFRSLFDPTDDPKVLVIELEDGGTATISARTVNLALSDDVEIGPTWRRVNIELEAVEGDWVIT
jgi:hypothetical protein